ncbi:MAG: hypothetical protein KJ718_03420 [Nanoarchaeota archaeon]|nr:hypothetical protein [Nanoarchaeota archaeon]MBU1051579.1 hypothetical protein [Nanoarchaeota archaeon]MBU1988670.1 hypothetical protein [Nanoarchaeota archaeon]
MVNKKKSRVKRKKGGAKKNKGRKKVMKPQKKKKSSGGFFGRLFGNRNDVKKADTKKVENKINQKKWDVKIKKKEIKKEITVPSIEDGIEKKGVESQDEVSQEKKSSAGFFGRLFGKKKKEEKKSKEHHEAVKKIIKTKHSDWKKLKKKSDKLHKELMKKSEKQTRLVEKPKKGKIVKDNALVKEDVLGGYLKTGVKGFDALFEKGYGIPRGAAVLVEGGPGSGKTIFCLSALGNMCAVGKKGLYMSFEEPEERLVEHMERFGWPARDYIKKGILRVKRFDAIDVSRSVEALLSAAKKELLIEVDPVLFPKDYDPDFIIVDSLTSIASAFSGHESRFRIYMEQLFRYLEKNKITNFLIREVSSPSHIGTTFKEQGEAVSFLSDGIIVIYNVIYNTGKRDAAIEILKMRGAHFKKRIVKADIIPTKGMIIYPENVLGKNKGLDFELT